MDLPHCARMMYDKDLIFSTVTFKAGTHTRYSQKITGKVALQCGLLRQWRKYLLTIQNNPPAVQNCASGNQRLGARRKELLWLALEPLMYRRHNIVIQVEFASPQGLFQWIRRRQVWGTRRVWQELKLHVSQHHHGGICYVRPGIFLLESDAFGQQTRHACCG
jgi:hypothetical protein